jgi:exosortase/archaeosortase family protein
MGGFEAVCFLPWVKNGIFPACMRLDAQVGARVLRLLGQEAVADGAQIVSPRFAIEIRRGCDAIEPSAVFLSALIAFPAAIRTKIPGAVIGAVLLAVVNIIRIVSLFLVGVHYPSAFQVLHVDVWQAMFIFLAILLWVLWASWALRSAGRMRDVAAAEA